MNSPTITRRTPRQPANIAAAIRQEVVRRVNLGEDIKAIAYEIKRVPSTVRRYSWEAGFRCMLVNQKERTQLLTQRRKSESPSP